MKKNNKISNQPFIPVILGANIGVYSTARTFHEAYNVKSISISREYIGPVINSVILQNVIESGMENKEILLKRLKQVSETYPNIPKFLIGSADWHVEMAVDLKEDLSNDWIVPYTDRETLNSMTNKVNFYNVCEELNVDYPKFIISDLKKDENYPEPPFEFPLVIKPAKSISYQNIKFSGKKKVFIAYNKDEYDKIFSLLREANFQGEMIIQEFIPGDDTSMHILTLYTDQNGKTCLGSFGQTLLEDHTPGGIGNPLVIRTFRNNEVVEQARRIVEHVGWVGFSNFDLKYDERDGKYKFFELNPRLGRSNYYVTAEGHNAAEYYVKDFLYNEQIEYSVAENEVLYNIIPKRLLLKNIKHNDLKKKVKSLYKKRLVKNPMNYFPVEKNIKRLIYVIASTFNYYRKFKKYPPL